MSRTWTLFGIAAGSLIGGVAHAQEWLKVPQGGLQVVCSGNGKGAEVDSLSFFFDMNADVDPMFGPKNITFDKIAINPSKQSLSYTFMTGIFLDNYDGQLHATRAPMEYVSWKDSSNQFIENSAEEFIKTARKACRNTDIAPVRNGMGEIIKIVRCGITHPLTRVANDIKDNLGMKIN